jgi:deazaflavin-dependent oxidoreductase (nitroreductase family)
MAVWARRSLVWLLGLVGFVVLVDLATTVVQVVSRRTRWTPGLDAIRWFNKRVRNPATLKVAGSRVTAVHHTGRRSGKEYVTPVWAEQVGESFFIHLPYGTEVDWCRNVLAAGGCAVQQRRARVDTVSPLIVPATEALPVLPRKMRRMDRLFGVEWYLRLDISQAETPARKAG